MRRMIVGLVVSVVVVAGLPAVASAGNNEVEHPPIDCYGGNGFNSEFVSDVDWGFPCVAYDGYSAVGETDRTKRYTLWDGSQKLIAYFYGREDLGLSSGDECRFPDGTVTTDTWVIRGFWKTTVVCKAPPAPTCVGEELLFNDDAETGNTDFWTALTFSAQATPPGNGSFSFQTSAGSSLLTQLVDVSFYAADIDAGVLTIESGGFGRIGAGVDWVVEYNEAGFNLIGSTGTGIPVVSGSFSVGPTVVPVGTRTILVGVPVFAGDGGDFLDDLYLRICTSPSAPV